MPRAFVEHPISDQTKQQLQAKADDVFDQVVAALTQDDFMTGFDSLRAVASSASCDSGGGS